MIDYDLFYEQLQNKIDEVIQKHPGLHQPELMQQLLYDETEQSIHLYRTLNGDRKQ